MRNQPFLELIQNFEIIGRFSCAQEAPEHKITKEVKLSKRVIENDKIEPSPPRIVRSSPFSKLIGI